MEKNNFRTGTRAYRKGDENQITDLFRISIDNPRTVSYWKWANLKNPFSQSISLVVEDYDKNIVGHYSVMVLKLICKDRSFSAGFGAQLVIHPRFRNFKIMWELLNNVWSISKENGLSFIYAFPNNNIWPLKNKMMGWQLIKEFNALELDLKNAKLNHKEISEIKFQRIGNLSQYKAVINNIWSKNSDKYKNLIHIERTYDFVNWRFFRHPLEHYPFYLVKDRSGSIIGWMALKFYRKSGLLYGHIIDYNIIGEGLDSVLIRHAISYFSKNRVDVVSAWCSSVAKVAYDDIGFVEKGFSTNFGIKPLDEDLDDMNGIFDYDGWDMAMSYSDAF